MYIEKEFAEIDFSPLSKIKDSLLANLLAERKKFSPSRIEFSEDELDFLAAAGNNLQNKKEFQTPDSRL